MTDLEEARFTSHSQILAPTGMIGMRKKIEHPCDLVSFPRSFFKINIALSRVFHMLLFQEG